MAQHGGFHNGASAEEGACYGLRGLLTALTGCVCEASDRGLIGQNWHNRSNAVLLLVFQACTMVAKH